MKYQLAILKSKMAAIWQQVPLVRWHALADELCGCIGCLMAGSGMVEVLSEAFGGVLKMLSGKK